MKPYPAIFGVASLATLFATTGCVSVNVQNEITSEPAPDSTTTTLVGPDHDADVQLGDADFWVVPQLHGSANSPPVVWTLLHPDEPTTVTVRRVCGNQSEPFLWLSDPPNWSNNSALATFNGCGVPGEFFATVELAFDGTAWVGVSASGAATILPPE